MEPPQHLLLFSKWLQLSFVGPGAIPQPGATLLFLGAEQEVAHGLGGWQCCEQVLWGAGCARAAPGMLALAASHAPALTHPLPSQPATESGLLCWKWSRVWVCYVNWQSASWFTKTSSLVLTFTSQAKFFFLPCPTQLPNITMKNGGLSW